MTVLIFIILIMDIIVAVTANVRNAGKFIRRLRHCVYSITPAMYIVISLLIVIAGKIFNAESVAVLMSVSLLLLGCCTAYAEKFFTRRKTQKKRIPARKLKLITEKKG